MREGGAGGASGTGVRSAWGGFGELAPVLAGGVSLWGWGEEYMMPVCGECWCVVARLGLWGRGAWLGWGAGGMVVGGCVGCLWGIEGAAVGSWAVWELNVLRARYGEEGWGGLGVLGGGESGWVKGCAGVGVVGVVDGGAPGRAWGGCVGGDMGAVGVGEEVARGRCAWRGVTGGPTRASADA